MQDKTNKPVVFSALEVANICGVVNQTAINWIKGGHLKAFTTPGGQYRVYPDDLAEFMKERDMRIPDELAKHCTGVTVAKKSILVVDDDRGLNTVITKFLEKKYSSENFEFFQAFDGFEAGVLMTEKHPGCIVLDLDLPGVDGFSLCKKIKTSSNFGKPAVIVITALEDSDTEERVRELGVKHFFKKPLNLVEVAQAVSTAI